jgi:lauroyl/myristoyl acyltransferase
VAVSFPIPLKYWIALRVSDMYFLFHKRNREAALYNFSKIPLQRERYKVARDMFHNFSKYLADFFFISRLNKYNWRELVSTVNLEYFDKAYREKKGIIAITAHIGNWELGGTVLSLMGYPTSAIVLPHHNKAVNDIFLKQRESKELKSIFLGVNLKESFKRLKNGEVVAILGDRNLRVPKAFIDEDINDSNGVEVELFGEKAYFPKGPAILAYWTDAIILPGFTIRGKDNKYTLYFERPVPIEKCENKEDFIKINTQKIAALIEKYVQLYPEQWCVFEKIWV